MPIIATFGELMLRLKPPGSLRLDQASTLEAIFGGGEANVAAALVRFGNRGRYITVLPDNPIGDWAMGELRRDGLDTEFIVRGGNRLGIYFLEAGHGPRASSVVYDRAGSSFAEMDRDAIDWDEALSGADWLHVTGITPALSPACASQAAVAMRMAKGRGLTVSFDINYRRKLWSRAEAARTLGALMEDVDVLIANESDCCDVFAISAEASDPSSGQIDADGYLGVAKEMLKRFSGLDAVAITLRESRGSTRNGWGGLLADRQGHAFGPRYDIDVLDRIGAGDAFAAGLIHALISGYQRDKAIAFAVAAGAMKHAIAGDFLRARLAEIEALAAGDASGRIQR